MLSTLPGALLLFGILIAWFTLVLLYGMSWNNLRVEIELHHAVLWRQLGSPGSAQKIRRLFGSRDFPKFVITGRYREIGDPTLTRLGNRARLWFAIVLLVWAGFCISILWFAGHR